MTEDVTIRPGTVDDIDALVELEERVFDSDRMNRRSFRRLMDRPTAAFIVAERRGHIVGYVLLLFRSGTALARLYSIAVDDGMRGRGLGAKLLDAAEQTAFDRDCIFLRLEVRSDNKSAISLYRKRGYRQFGRYFDYYADHADALRFEKRLTDYEPREGEYPPYYGQTTDFTCGPACMLMTLAWFDRSYGMNRTAEFKLWREATTIFMTSGLGGCEPFGMAVALARHGLKPEIFSSRAEHFFVKGVRNKGRRDVMRMVQDEFRSEARELDIPVHRRAISRKEMAEAVAGDGVAIALVSGYKLFRDSTPHWVLVHDSDDQHVYIHDPWIEDSVYESEVAVAGLPIPWREFETMSRIGRERRSAAIVVNGEIKR